MERIRADICVIGAGAGGLSVAAGAAQMGARVVLVEGGEMGGDCLNYGCVPSKALIAAAGRAHAMAGGLGIAPAAPQVDFTAVMAHVRATIAAIAPHDSQERFEGLGVRVIRAWGRFASPHELAAGGHLIRARRFVIATGSSPAVPPVPGLEALPHLTSETVWGLSALPGHLLVLGAGPIGLELAQAFRRLGSAVTVVEAATALGREDPDLSAPVLAGLRAEGVEILEGTAVDEAGGQAGRQAGGQAGAVWLRLSDGRRVEGSHLLVAAGRRPNLDRLDLTAGGIARDKAGVSVGPGLRSTTNRRVHAVGDAAGLGQFTHLAGHHAGVVVRSALLALPARARADHIPRVTFTDPPIAHVGLTEAEARARHGARLEVLRVPYGESDRARAEGRTGGLLKVMVVRGRPVGASIAGLGADEMIGLWSLAIANRLKMGAIAGTVLPYPTLNELSKRAVSAYFSPRLFDSPVVERVVGLVQRLLP